MRRTTLIVLSSIALASCGTKEPASPTDTDGSNGAGEEAPASSASGQQSTGTETTAWSDEFSPPMQWETERFRLEPLAPKHNQMDYEAAQGSREHLQRTLQWGDWPSADMTPEDNIGDLERHWKEFERREAYAYTALAPDGSECMGCVYLNPVGTKGEPQAQPRRMRMAFWVVESGLASDLDKALVEEVLTMVEAEFPIDQVDIPIHVKNERGIEVLRDLGLTDVGASDTHRMFVWRRGA